MSGADLMAAAALLALILALILMMFSSIESISQHPMYGYIMGGLIAFSSIVTFIYWVWLFIRIFVTFIYWVWLS